MYNVFAEGSLGNDGYEMKMASTIKLMWICFNWKEIELRADGHEIHDSIPIISIKLPIRNSQIIHK